MSHAKSRLHKRPFWHRAIDEKLVPHVGESVSQLILASHCGWSPDAPAKRRDAFRFHNLWKLKLSCCSNRVGYDTIKVCWNCFADWIEWIHYHRPWQRGLINYERCIYLPMSAVEYLYSVRVSSINTAVKITCRMSCKYVFEYIGKLIRASHKNPINLCILRWC